MVIDICADAYADGIRFDFACGDEVYGNCTQLRESFEATRADPAGHCKRS